jgi:type II secretory pathway pseudopilin PulG
MRSDRGQSLVTVLVLLPVLLGAAALVIDGANAFAQKRKAQNVADATALAAAQSIASSGGPPPACPAGGAPPITVALAADCYSRVNDGPFGPDLDQCTEYDPTVDGYRPDPGKGCYASPYIDKDGNPHEGKVEVRITRPVGGFFLDAIHIGSIFGKGAFARAVATATPTTATECGPPDPSVPPNDECVYPGPDAVQGTYQPPEDAHCTFDPPVENPDQYVTTDPPCTIPGTAPVQGTHVPAEPEHCTFDPPVDNPDQYLPDCIIPGTDPVQGTLDPAEPAHCDFSSADPPVAQPWDQYLDSCLYPGADPIYGEQNTVITGSDISMDE